MKNRFKCNTGSKADIWKILKCGAGYKWTYNSRSVDDKKSIACK